MGCPRQASLIPIEEAIEGKPALLEISLLGGVQKGGKALLRGFFSFYLLLLLHQSLLTLLFLSLMILHFLSLSIVLIKM